MAVLLHAGRCRDADGPALADHRRGLRATFLGFHNSKHDPGHDRNLMSILVVIVVSF